MSETRDALLNLLPGDMSDRLYVRFEAALTAHERAVREECALDFDRMAEAQDAEATRYEQYRDRLGRWHPARASAQQCRDEASVLRKHAARIRAGGRA